LTGAGTVVADDPRLDVRLVDTQVQPLRVVIDSWLRAPARSRVFDPPGSVLVYCAHPDRAAAAALRERAVEVMELAADDETVDLSAVIKDLAARGVNELHVEAGPTLNGALMRAGLIDEFLIYLAPKLIGSGRGMIDGHLSDLSQAWPLRFEGTQAIGDDLRIVARRPSDLGWLD
jgi:diaminohydroxyphosphoribosylaminopyrimidine deaminase/5-amino-6-(5-phosphoribosylamino)uracil reductase